MAQLLADRAFERDALDFFPTPLADALDEAAGETSLRAQRDKVVEAFRVATRLLGLLTLAAAPAGPVPGGQLAELLKKLLRQGLTDGEWIGLAREMLRSFALAPEKCSFPPLVASFFSSGGKLAALFSAQGPCDKLLAMRKSDTVAHGVTGTEATASDVLTARLPDFEVFLRGLDWLWRLALVLPVSHEARGDGLWQYSVLKFVGVTPRRGFRPEPLVTRAEMTLGSVYACLEGAAPVLVHPLIQYEDAGAGQPEIFLFEEVSRHEVILRTFPSGLRRHDADAARWLRQRFSAAAVRAAEVDAEPAAWAVGGLRETARKASDDYLDKMQRERIYLPHLYARRRDLEVHLASFLSRECTKSGVLIVGGSGIGKTNTLCHIVKHWREEPSRLGGDVVLLLGGSTLPGGQFSLRDVILDRLETTGSFGGFLSTFEAQRSAGEQFVLIVDGVDKHPQPAELMRQLDDLVVRAEQHRWLKIVVSLGEATYGALGKAGFIPAVRNYYSVTLQKGPVTIESPEVALGRMADDELADAYERYRQEPGMTPLSSFESLTEDVRNAIRNPLFLKIVMEVFNGRRVPRRTLTAEVLLEYCNKKIFCDGRRTFFVNRLVDILYQNRWTAARFDALLDNADLRDLVLDFSPQSPFVQLLDEQVLEEQLKRVSSVLPPQRTIAFAYDRLLEYALLNYVVNRVGQGADAVAAVSDEAASYLPLRGVLLTLLAAKTNEGDLDYVVLVLGGGNAEVMKHVGLGLLIELEQAVTLPGEASDDKLAATPLGRLVTQLLAGGDRRSLDLLLDFGERLIDLGQYRRAAFVYRSLEGSAGDASAPELVVRAARGMGTVKDVLGDKRGALGDYDVALRVSEAAGDRMSEQALLDALGQVHLELGDIRAARDYFERSLQIDRALAAEGAPGGQRGLAQTLLNLALAHQKTGDLERAVTLTEEARQTYLDADNPRGVAAALSQKGVLARRRGLLDESRRWHLEALAVHQDTGDQRGIARDMKELGHVDLMDGSWSDAIAHYNSALAIYHEIGDKAGIASTQNALGEVYRWMGNHEGALEAYASALRLYEEMDSRNGVEMCTLNLGATHLFAGDSGRALDLLQRALAIERDQLGSEDGEPECLAYLSAAAWAQGHAEQALAYSDAAVRVTQQSRFSEEDVQLVYFYRYVIFAGLGRREEALEALRISRDDVMRQAEALPSTEARERFLSVFPLRRSILEAWRSEESGSS